MTQIAQVGAVSARMPTQWGIFEAIGFERGVSNGSKQVESALAIVLGDLTEDAPLLRIHSQYLTGEVFGSLRCDCKEQLEISVGPGFMIMHPVSRPLTELDP